MLRVIMALILLIVLMGFCGAYLYVLSKLQKTQEELELTKMEKAYLIAVLQTKGYDFNADIGLDDVEWQS